MTERPRLTAAPLHSPLIPSDRKEARLITVASWRLVRSSWRSMAFLWEVGSTRMLPASSQRPSRPKRRITLTSWWLSQDYEDIALYAAMFNKTVPLLWGIRLTSTWCCPASLIFISGRELMCCWLHSTEICTIKIYKWILPALKSHTWVKSCLQLWS